MSIDLKLYNRKIYTTEQINSICLPVDSKETWAYSREKMSRIDKNNLVSSYIRLITVSFDRFLDSERILSYINHPWRCFTIAWVLNTRTEFHLQMNYYMGRNV